MFFVMLGTTNGSNFTDGLDGLATSVTAVITAFFWIFGLICGGATCVATSAMFGALFLLAAHGVSGKLPKELSAGVVCALCGSPFFLYLLCLRRGAECPRGGR